MSSVNYWKDLLMLKTEDKIRTSLNEFKGAYYFARKIRRYFPLKIIKFIENPKNLKFSFFFIIFHIRRIQVKS